ncbi:SpvB/TcaC N-terminal domain-containing protein [Sorangium sp. So ce406]|uniref:SpvB/TcaC N-terminal domain-containing protein n=1 Tax=Sorangium sp. So ce406 TaxID=3133311 RepID=UPI003F5AEE69
MAVACRTQGAHHPATPRPAPEVETVAAGTLPGTFSISSTGEAVYIMELASLPSRAGMGPRLQLVYRSDGGDGVLGAGFSIAGLSAITRCPSRIRAGSRQSRRSLACRQHQGMRMSRRIHRR